ncbi:MAG: DUF3791 domain-containing protein [Clostridia bacterium]|nr:DUF3791 domain-containing protein [Clostridia bacterium]
MNANPVLLQKKYARIIEAFSKREGITRGEALGFFYHSETYDLMSKGISDMHCMSDAYLVEDLENEYAKNNCK